VQDHSHVGARVLGERLPVFMSAAFLPVFAASTPRVDEQRKALAALREAARKAEDHVIGLGEQFGREDEAQAVALREAVEAGVEPEAVDVTPAELRAVKVAVAREQFAVRVEALCAGVVAAADALRYGGARAELDALIAAAQTVGTMDPDLNAVRGDASSAQRLLLTTLAEPQLGLDVAHVRRLVSPLAVPAGAAA
jgi:hypothetical protein